MQPRDCLKTEHTGNTSSSGATAGLHSPLWKKEGGFLHRHLHSQWTLPVTSHITCQGNMLAPNTQKWKQKPFPAGPIKPDNCLAVDARKILNILAETQAFSRWESAYIRFMQTFPHWVCSHPFAAKQFSIISSSLHSSEFKILPPPKIRGVSITVLSEMKEVEASLTI